MADTPEGKVKRKITRLLREANECYYFMPVQTGYGAPTLDYLGCSRGRGFAIEAKAPGKTPTARQRAIIRTMEACGMQVFVISGNPEEYERLRLWLF